MKVKTRSKLCILFCAIGFCLLHDRAIAQAPTTINPSTINPSTVNPSTNDANLQSGQTEENVPVAYMANSSYEFDPVVEGVEVVHDFVIKNNGKGVLNISRVQTG